MTSKCSISTIAQFSVAMTVGALVVLLTAWAVQSPPEVVSGGAHTGSPVVAGAHPLSVSPGKRCAHSHDLDPASLGDRRQELLAPVLLPANKVASATDSWECNGTAVVMFGGVQATYSEEDSDVEPASFLRALASSNGGVVKKTSENDVFVRVPSDSEQNHTVAIFFAPDNSKVELIGTGGESDVHLLEIATSMLDGVQ